MDQLENVNKDRRCYICSLINPSGVVEVNDSANILLKVSMERVTDTLTCLQIWCVSSYITAMALLELGHVYMGEIYASVRFSALLKLKGA